MKVYVCGGTGFIGYQVCLQLLEKGHEVSSISLGDVELGSWWPKDKIKTKIGDLFTMEADELVEMFTGYDAMVYAVGPDDRYTPKAPAYKFFYDRLVLACAKVVKAARDAGVKKCAICNSYFAYFDRIRPDEHLAEKHPYIRCRVEQAQKCIEIGGDKMAVYIMELPYIFGVHPVRAPIWKDLFIKRLLKMKPYIFFFKGGTNMITVNHVAEAIVGAILNGRSSKRYTIGDKNLTWVEWISLMLPEMGIDRKIKILPPFLGTLFAKRMKRIEAKKGLEPGLDLDHLFKDIQCRETYFDPTSSQEELGYTGGELEEAIKETVKKCMELINEESQINS